MMPCKLVGSEKGDGRLYSVTLQLMDPGEIKIFRKLLESEAVTPVCPKCQDPITGSDGFYLRVDSPLSPSAIGLDVATPIIRCDHCAVDTTLSMVDYSAFPSVKKFITALRVKYASKKRKEHNTNG